MAQLKISLTEVYSLAECMQGRLSQLTTAVYCLVYSGYVDQLEILLVLSKSCSK